MSRQLTALIVGIGLLAGCAPEAPPARTVTEFIDNPILLEAAMLRCAKDRATMKYEQECINAREAVKRIQAKEEERRSVELEARSERKRQALRRTQQAAAEARRRSAEAERLRKEAEYLAPFGPGDGRLLMRTKVTEVTDEKKVHVGRGVFITSTNEYSTEFGDHLPVFPVHRFGKGC